MNIFIHIRCPYFAWSRFIFFFHSCWLHTMLVKYISFSALSFSFHLLLLHRLVKGLLCHIYIYIYILYLCLNNTSKQNIFGAHFNLYWFYVSTIILLMNAKTFWLGVFSLWEMRVVDKYFLLTSFDNLIRFMSDCR